MLIFVVLTALLALAVGLGLLLAARLLKGSSGIPVHARVIYSDTGAWKPVAHPFFSHRYGLTGKPDYLLEDAGVVIPVEVKPNRRARLPHESDVLQLAAYGLLIQEVHGQEPLYGLLKYRDAVFRVDFTPELQSRLLHAMDVMRRDLDSTDVPRSHAEGSRCRACGFREVCGQALDG